MGDNVASPQNTSSDFLGKKRPSMKLVAVFGLFAVTILAAGYFLFPRSTPIAEPPIEQVVKEGTFKVLDDGTAYAKGAVIEHVPGCEVDGVCKLILNINGEKVALVYAEGDFACKNLQAVSWVHWGQNVIVGTQVKAYGAYGKLGDTHNLTFCDSKEYFILGENDPVRVGEYTEKFFDAAAERKGGVEGGEPPNVPAMRVWYKGKNHEGQRGSGCWAMSKETGTLCWDTALPTIFKTTVSVPTEDELTVFIDAHKPPISLSATFFDAETQTIVKQRTLLPKSEAVLPLEVPAGNYIVSVFGVWDEGDVSYVFKVRAFYVEGNPLCESLVDEAAQYYEPYAHKEGELGYQRQNIIRECNTYLNKSCTTSQECGSFPCSEGTCLIRACNQDSQCPITCGLHATPVPRFCTTIDVQ